MSQKFNSVDEQSVIIGNNVMIKPFTVIGMTGFGFEKNEAGNYKIPLQRKAHKFKVIIKDDCEIGVACVIDKGSWRHSIIEKGTKLDNMCHTGHNSHIGKYCLLAVGVRLGGSCTIKDYCQLGMGVIVNPGITIADHVTIGSGAIVTKDITQSHSTWQGIPARKVADEQKPM